MKILSTGLMNRLEFHITRNYKGAKMAFILIILINLLLLSVIDPDSNLNHWRLDQPENHKLAYKPKCKFPRKTTYFRRAGQKRHK